MVAAAGIVSDHGLRVLWGRSVATAATSGTSASTPGHTRYHTHDITTLVANGTNVVGLLSGHVMVGGNANMASQSVMALLVVDITHGTHQDRVVFTTGSGEWLQARSYVTSDSAWATTINWTMHAPAWSTPSFTPGPSWTPAAQALAFNPPSALAMPVATVLAEVRAVSVRKVGSGHAKGPGVVSSWLYTFPKNFVGTLKIAALPSATQGSTISVQLGEWLEGGNAMPVIAGGNAAQGKGQQFEDHILRSGNEADLETLFCWHGFVYAKVTATGNTTFGGAIDSLVGLEIRTNLTATGTLLFGGDGVNGSTSERAASVLGGINEMVLQSQRTNVAAYMPTDCPTREKHGWLGDALDASEEAMYNFDMEAVHAAFLRLIDDNQGDQGDVPVVVPFAAAPQNASCNDIAWTAAYPQLAAFMWQYYGSGEVLESRWASLARFQENLVQTAALAPPAPPWPGPGPGPSGSAGNGSLATCDRFGDWLAPTHCHKKPGPGCCVGGGALCPVKPVMGGFNYVLGLDAMGDVAAALNKSADAARYRRLATGARAMFHATFYSNTTGYYGGVNSSSPDVQTLTAPPLLIGSAPAALRPVLAGQLEADLANQTAHHPSVGAVVSKILLNVLSANGLHADALKVATQTTEPSWGYWVAQGSTTCWETWKGLQSGTRNHIFLCGGVGEWMWKHLAGLTPIAPAFARVAVAPRMGLDVGPRHVAAAFLSPRGTIEVSWRLRSVANSPAGAMPAETTPAEAAGVKVGVFLGQTGVSMARKVADTAADNVSADIADEPTDDVGGATRVEVNVTLPVGVEGASVTVPTILRSPAAPPFAGSARCSVPAPATVSVRSANPGSRYVAQRDFMFYWVVLSLPPTRRRPLCSGKHGDSSRRRRSMRPHVLSLRLSYAKGLRLFQWRSKHGGCSSAAAVDPYPTGWVCRWRKGGWSCGMGMPWWARHRGSSPRQVHVHTRVCALTQERNLF